MRFSRIISIIVCIIFTIASFGEFTTYAASGEATATSQASKKKSSKKSSSSKKKKSSTSSKKKKKNSSKKKKKSKKSRSKSKSKSKRSKSKNRKKRRNVARTVYKETPKEVAQNDTLTLSVNSALLSRIPKHLDPGGLRINSVKPDKIKRQANVGLNDNFTYSRNAHRHQIRVATHLNRDAIFRDLFTRINALGY